MDYILNCQRSCFSCLGRCLSQCNVDTIRRMLYCICCCSRNNIEEGNSERTNTAKNEYEMNRIETGNSESKMCNRPETAPNTTVFYTDERRCTNKKLEDEKDNRSRIPPVPLSSSVCSSYPDKIVSTPRGLCNVGNTCYFNSVIQSLCHTHILYEELHLVNQKETMSHSFHDLCREMHNGELRPLYPKRNQLITKFPKFNNHRQHDSHEYLRHFLDEIRKEEKAVRAHLLTAVDKIFGGHLVTVYICMECDKHYHLFEPCLDISLPVFMNAANEADSFSNVRLCYEREENNYKKSVAKLATPLGLSSKSRASYYSNKKKAISLEDCLTHFSRVEQINEEYLCEDCLRKAMANGEADEDNLKLTSATKQTLIFNPPAILTIHLKRFELLPGRARKRSDIVGYPEYLDIAPYCSSQCLRNNPPRNNIWYSLYAVVVHSGSLEGGHYWAYVKVRERSKNVDNLKKFLQRKYFNHNVTTDELMEMMRTKRPFKKADMEMPKRDESKWFLLNDDRVREISVESVLCQEAYLLFYERVVDDKQGADYETCPNKKNYVKTPT